MTVREAARVMSFPDRWRLKGPGVSRCGNLATRCQSNSVRCSQAGGGGSGGGRVRPQGHAEVGGEEHRARDVGLTTGRWKDKPPPDRAWRARAPDERTGAVGGAEPRGWRTSNCAVDLEGGNFARASIA